MDNNNLVDYKRVWVNREDLCLEYKIWLIFDLKFSKRAEKAITDFIEQEMNRCQKYDASASELIDSASHYNNLNSDNQILPPRLIAIDYDELINMELGLVEYKGSTLGDSVIGILPFTSNSINQDLYNKLPEYQKVLFNPGVLARICVEFHGKKSYVYQLAHKNLNKRGQIFYKPIGGHIKYNSKHIASIQNEYGIDIKNPLLKEDINDVSFELNPTTFDQFTETFDGEMLGKNKYYYFENPSISIKRELMEEIGPIDSTDGISLLSSEDIEYAINGGK